MGGVRRVSRERGDGGCSPGKDVEQAAEERHSEVDYAYVRRVSKHARAWNGND